MKVVDVREPAERATGTLDGAVLAPLGTLKSAATGWPKEEPLLIVCRTGRRSQKAAEDLRGLGFESVAVLEGGMEAVQTKKRASSVWSMERQVRLVAGTLAFLGTLGGLTISPWFFGVSLFIGAGLAFAALTDTCTMGMMLMKLPWNRGSRS